MISSIMLPQTLLDILVGVPTVPATVPSAAPPNASNPQRGSPTSTSAVASVAEGSELARPVGAGEPSTVVGASSPLPSLSMLGSMGLSACISLCMSIPTRVQRYMRDAGIAGVAAEPSGSGAR